MTERTRSAFLNRWRSRWVSPDEHEITKFFPNNPPERGDYVLVDGERHKVLRCPLRWNGRDWQMKRGVKVRPAPLPEWMRPPAEPWCGPPPIHQGIRRDTVA